MAICEYSISLSPLCKSHHFMYLFIRNCEGYEVLWQFKIICFISMFYSGWSISRFIFYLILNCYCNYERYRNRTQIIPFCQEIFGHHECIIRFFLLCIINYFSFTFFSFFNVFWLHYFEQMSLEFQSNDRIPHKQ